MAIITAKNVAIHEVLIPALTLIFHLNILKIPSLCILKLVQQFFSQEVIQAINVTFVIINTIRN